MSLTVFQKNAADNAYEQLTREDGSGKFLIADEVGLGKTIIAREIIRKIIENSKQDQTSSLTIVYICSNQLLARKNIKKMIPKELKNWEMKLFPCSRLSLLPLNEELIKTGKQEEKQENENTKTCYFYALTPGTSLNITNGNGTIEERMMLYILAGGKFDGEFSTENELIRKYGTYKDKDNNVCEFTGWKNLYNNIRDRYAEKWIKLKEYLKQPKEPIKQLEKFDPEEKIYAQRKILTQFGASLLKPDIVIFDEFQNYENIFVNKQKTDNELLAELDIINTVFAAHKPKYLLLSATPFAPLTMNEEISRGEVDLSSCQAFTQLVTWLLEAGSDKSNSFSQEWKHYSELFKTYCQNLTEENYQEAKKQKEVVEKLIRSVISRTERPADKLENLVQKIDKTKSVLSFCTEFRKEKLFRSPPGKNYSKRLLEFEKYAFKPLSAMRSDYTFISEKDRVYLQKNFFQTLDKLETEIDSPYFKRLRLALGENTDPEKNIDYSLLFWMPPTVPFYELKGPFKTAHDNGFSKILIFSAWRYIPRMISAAMSGHVENKIWDKKNVPVNLDSYHFLNSGKLDPIAEEMLDARKLDPIAEEMLDSRIDGIQQEAIFKSPAKSVFYALQKIDPDICKKDNIKKTCQHWATTIAFALMQRLLRQDGKKILSKTWDLLKDDSELCEKLEINPAQTPKAEKLAKMYCYAGCFAAVAYEYLYLLFQESHNEKLDEKVINDICGIFLQTLKLRVHPIQLDFYGDYIEKNGCKKRGIHPEYVNLHFADCFSEREKISSQENENESSQKNEKASVLPEIMKEIYGDQDIKLKNENDYDNTPIRNDTLQSAFNSPFKPFVLTTTSIGQEGLDFHWYCRKIMHWNLPGSPLEFDQREGRINRYCSFALRQILAAGVEKNANFSWPALFENKKPSNDENGLIPMWLPPQNSNRTSDNRRIERIVPYYPLSREHLFLENLLKLQAIYRMVIGQPHQEELLSLIQGLSPDQQEKIKNLTISLTPQVKECNQSHHPVK